MSARREFLKLAAVGPAAGILGSLLAETGRGTFAAEVESAAELLGRIPKNIIYTEKRPGRWDGKATSHVPVVEAAKADKEVKMTVQTKHPMSESHYIVRHVVISEDGEVLGAKTFSWKDEPVSTHEIKLTAIGGSKQVFVTSFCSLHDLWLAHAKVDV